MISSEPIKPNLVVVMQGGASTGADQNTLLRQPQVRPAAQNKSLLDVQQEKEVLLEAWQEFVDTNQPSTYRQVQAMPEIFEQLIKRSPTKNVSKLKQIFKSCLALIHDKDAIT